MAKKGIEVQCIFKFINHKKRANACYYDDLTVVALRNIKKGEEITHNPKNQQIQIQVQLGKKDATLPVEIIKNIENAEESTTFYFKDYYDFQIARVESLAG